MTTEPTILLVRHGQTEWNVEGRLQGHLDSPLTEAGRGHARSVADLLTASIAPGTEIRIEASPLGRARATAAIICERLGVDPATVIVDPRLAEHEMGEWSGLTHAEVDARYPSARRDRELDHWAYAVPGGESYAVATIRARAWLDVPRPAGVTIAVTHEMQSRTLQGAYLGLTPTDVLALSHPHDRVIRLADGRSENLNR